MISLEELNTLSQDEFVAALDGIFEHSPWVAERAAGARPFTSPSQLLGAMQAVVQTASLADQLALIRAHPQLGVPGQGRQRLTRASAREQRRAGLAACAPQDLARLEQLNAAYFEKFGFPFILAVRGHDPASILANCERRLRHDEPRERRTALDEIGLIAGYRLSDVLGDGIDAGGSMIG